MNKPMRPRRRNPKEVVSTIGVGIHPNTISDVETVARLIAAAPELLNACKLVCAIGLNAMSTQMTQAQVLSVVKAAIAKAEGGSNE